MRLACALGALLVCLCGGARAAAQRVEALTLMDPSLRPVSSPNASSSSNTLRRDMHSADGRFVLVDTQATNVTAAVDDLNGEGDVYLLDTVAGTKTLVSHRAGAPGITANGQSRGIALSRDGNRVLFASLATDVLAGQSDGNAGFDLFLFDRGSGQTLLVSRQHPSATATSDGASPDGFLDGSGQRVVFRTTGTNLLFGVTDANAADDAYLFDASGPTPTLRLLSSNAAAPSQAGSARSIPVAISRDGQRIAVISGASALVSGQTGAGEHLFLMDRFGTRRMVSHASGSATTGGNADSGDAQFSGDGRWLVFGSRASNLVAGVTDTNTLFDIFLHDCIADATTLVTSSAASATTAGNAGGNATALINDDGTRIAFSSGATNLMAGITDTNGSASDVFLQETATRARTLASFRQGTTSTGTGASTMLDFDDTGTRVLFESAAPDLLTGQVDGATSRHLFLYSLSGNSNQLVARRFDSALTASAQATTSGRLTADGAAAIYFGGDDLDAADDNSTSDVFAFRNGANTRLTHADPAVDNTQTSPSAFSFVTANGIDERGRYVAFTSTSDALIPGLADNEFVAQIYIHDRADRSILLATQTPAGPTRRSNGTIGEYALSGDGEWLAYVSTATDLAGATGVNGNAQLYLYGRGTGAVQLASHATGLPTQAGNGAASGTPRISSDGRFVAYLSSASNLIAGQTGVATDNLFLYDRLTDTTTLVTHAAASPTQAAGGSAGTFALTPDGASLAFASFSAEVASGVPDTNGVADVFVHVRATGANLPVSRSRSSTRMAFGGSVEPDISDDGRHVVFRSVSTELLPGPPATGGSNDVFLWRRDDDSMRLASHNAGIATQHGNGDSTAPQISGNGARIVFHSRATDLVAGFSSPHGLNSLFGHETASNTVTLLGHAAGNAAQSANAEVLATTLARGGTHAAFASRASNFVLDQADPGGQIDVFLVDLATREIFLASHRLGEPNVAALTNTSAAAVAPSISRDGMVTGFSTRGDDLVRHDIGSQDAFAYVHDEPTFSLIVDVNPPQVRAGEPYVVSVNLDVSRGPAIGHVVVSEGTDTCEFDIIAADDNRGACELVSATPGPRTLVSQFTSTAGFAPSRATLDITVLAPAQADIAMTMSAPASVAPGDVFDLTVEASNAGPDGTGQARVDFDGLPEVVATFGVGWNCPAVPEFHCVLDILPVGEAGPLTVRLQAPPADAQLDIEASIASPIIDPDTGDNAHSLVVQVDAAPEITQVSPPSGNTEGGYPLQVSGANFGTATGSVDLGGLPCAVTVWTPTQIVCSVPSGAGVRDVEVVQAASVLDRTSFSAFAYLAPVVATIAPAIGSSDGNFPLTVNGSNFGASGASVAIAGAACTNVQHDAAQPHRRITCTVPAGTGNNLPVVVTQAGQDSDGAARFAYASVVSDLLIAKSSARAEVFSRNIDEWTILVSNLGPDAADGARVVDVLPAHLTSVSWTCTGLAGASCGAPSGLGNIDLLLDLPVGGSALLQVSARIPRAPLLDLVNTATVATPAGQADPSPANNTDSETDPMATIFFDDFEPQ